jgi:hypothetical protein
MPKPLSAIILICEKALHEADEVISAIRIADAFYVPPPLPGIPIESHHVMMNLIIMCKFKPDDESKHSLTLLLRRPNGTEKNVDFGKPIEVSLSEIDIKVPGSPRGFNFICMPWGVKAICMGVHQVVLSIDGEEVTSTFFTLAPQVAQENG